MDVLIGFITQTLQKNCRLYRLDPPYLGDPASYPWDYNEEKLS